MKAMQVKTINAKHLDKADDDFNPMNIDDPVFIEQGLNYLNKVKQDLKKGIINGKVVGITKTYHK